MSPVAAAPSTWPVHCAAPHGRELFARLMECQAKALAATQDDPTPEAIAAIIEAALAKRGARQEVLLALGEYIGCALGGGIIVLPKPDAPTPLRLVPPPHVLDSGAEANAFRALSLIEGALLLAATAQLGNDDDALRAMCAPLARQCAEACANAAITIDQWHSGQASFESARAPLDLADGRLGIAVATLDAMRARDSCAAINQAIDLYNLAHHEVREATLLLMRAHEASGGAA